MKIFDLLKNIYENKPVPYRIKYLQDEYYYEKTTKNYRCVGYMNFLFCGNIASMLNNSIEVIEDHKHKYNKSINELISWLEKEKTKQEEAFKNSSDKCNRDVINGLWIAYSKTLLKIYGIPKE